MQLSIENNYDKVNMIVYAEFEQTALTLIDIGRKHYGAKGIMENIRFNTLIKDGSEFKINNSFTSLYVRLFNERNPNNKGFFETRKSKYDK